MVTGFHPKEGGERDFHPQRVMDPEQGSGQRAAARTADPGIHF